MRAPGAAALCLLAAAAALVASGGEVASATGGPFCESAIGRDYEAPFERMPPDHPPPEGELPFGPRNMSMFRVDWTSVVLRGSNLGYRFGAKDADTRTLRLNWDVTARLLRVDSGGRVLREVGRRHDRIRDAGGYDRDGIDLPEFVFPAGRVGLYRVDLSFRSLRGKGLASYREYFRVVPRTVELELRLSADSLRPGETLYAYVADLGTRGASVPVRYAVKRFDGSGWASAGTSVTPGDALDPDGGWWMNGGEASFCTEYQVPAAAASGRYRVSTTVQVTGTRWHRVLSAPFSIQP
ncbi:MAG TPA: hypothetical protein VG898_06595 [Solirubrobacterales bacterium]|nr:hypothetical protein [Solirubrobacterales bacterium]